MDNTSFREHIYVLVATIPQGRVMTYGDIAALCGRPRAARIVGGVAHYGDTSLPWHRVVKKDGSLAEGYPGGVSAHLRHLQAEGTPVNSSGHVIMEQARWQPSS